MKKQQLEFGDILEVKGRGINDLGLVMDSKEGRVVLFSTMCYLLSDWGDDLRHVSPLLGLDVVCVRRPKSRYQFVRKFMVDAPVICYLGDHNDVSPKIPDRKKA